MKHPWLVLLLTVLTVNLVSSQDILWEKSYGGKYADYLLDVKPTADYGFLIAGSSLSIKSGNKLTNNNGDLDYWIWKMDEKGDLEWQKNFGGSGSDLLHSVCLTSDGGFLLGGTSSSNKSFDKKEDSKGQEDFWIIKLNAKGDEEWQKTLGGEWQEDLKTIVQTKDKGYILAGTSASNKSGDKSNENFGGKDYWIIKLNENGNIEWQKTFGGLYDDELKNIEETSDGGYIVGGYSNSNFSGSKTDENKGSNDFWVLKLDKIGVIEWQKTLGGNKDDQLYVIHQTYDKGYILGGSSNSDVGFNKTKSNIEGTDFWIIKLNNNGEVSWQETYNFGKIDVLNSLIENIDHTFLLGGYAKGEVDNRKIGKPIAIKGTDDYIALKISEKGEELWSRIVGSDGEDILNKVIETRDGGYLMAGTSNPQSVLYSEEGNSEKKRLRNNLNNSENENKQFENKKSELNDKISQTANEINKNINKTNSNVTNSVNNELGLREESPIKLNNNIDNSTFILPLIGNNSSQNNEKIKNDTEKKLPKSRDKEKNFGSNDFWVVKLKDSSKPDKIKLTIEAIPNPTMGLTNVIVGYDFETGTATIVDLAGRQLQQFEIINRTVPIDLSSYPEGIYIVNIKTNVQSNGIKVIKGINKN